MEIQWVINYDCGVCGEANNHVYCGLLEDMTVPSNLKCSCGKQMSYIAVMPKTFFKRNIVQFICPRCKKLSNLGHGTSINQTTVAWTLDVADIATCVFCKEKFKTRE